MLVSEQLEVRRLLAVAPIDASELEITSQPDPSHPGFHQVTIRRTDTTAAPMRLEIRHSAGGVAIRTDDASAFDPDLDTATSGVQSVHSISKLALIGGHGDDSFVLDETTGKLAAAFWIEGGPGSDRLEFHREVASAFTSHLVDVNVRSQSVTLRRDSAQSSDTRTAVHDSLEQLAFFGADDGQQDDLLVRSGSGDGDRLEWMPGRVDVGVAAQLGAMHSTRIWYGNMDATWLFTGGGSDSVMLRDEADTTSSPTTRSKLHVATQDEDDLVRVYLAGSRSSADISVDGDGGVNRLEIYSYRGQAERFLLTSNSLDYDSPAGTMAQFDYKGMQNLHLETGGGDDTVVADERGATTFANSITLYTQDDNDSIELSTAPIVGSAYWSLDGGQGRNGLTTMVRQVPLGMARANNASYPNVAAFVAFTQEQLTIGYQRPYTVPLNGTLPEVAASIHHERFGGLTLVAGDASSIDVRQDAGSAFPTNLRILITQVASNIRLAGLDPVLSRHIAIEASVPYTLEVVGTLENDLFNATSRQVHVQSSKGADTTISFDRPARLYIDSSKGNDTIYFVHDNALQSTSLLAGEGIDTIHVTLDEVDPYFGEGFAIFGSYEQDTLVLQDAPGKDLNLTLAESGVGRMTVDGIESLQFFGGDGKDRFFNDSRIPAMLDGGPGNDTLVGGSGHDTVFGGDGIDELVGRRGNDVLLADYDYLFALYALSHEVLDGSKGDDLLVTRGADQIVTSPGNDRRQDFPTTQRLPDPSNSFGGSSGSFSGGASFEFPPEGY